MTEILIPDHSSVLFSLSKEKLKKKRLGKINSSLTEDQNCIIGIKKLICNFSNEIEFLLNRQLKWEILKYEARKFIIKHTKYVAKGKLQQRTNLKYQLEKLEGKLDEDNLSKYNSVKNELDEIYDHIAGGTRIRSKCDWYEHGEKSKKFF